MEDSDSSEDEKPLGERKHKLIMMAMGKSNSHSNSPSNSCPLDSQIPRQSSSYSNSEVALQTGENVASVSHDSLNPDVAFSDEKSGAGSTNSNQRPRRQVVASKTQSRTATASAALPAASRGAPRDSIATASRGRGAGRGSRGAGTAGRRSRGRRGR